MNLREQYKNETGKSPWNTNALTDKQFIPHSVDYIIWLEDKLLDSQFLMESKEMLKHDEARQ